MTNSNETPSMSLNSIEVADQLKRRRGFWFRAIWISLVGVVVPPMIGVVGTVFGMKKAFGELSGDGIANPTQLSEHISSVLIFTATGLTLSVIFFIVLIVALIRFFTLPAVPSASNQANLS